MTEQFNVANYLAYFGARWHFCALACVAAGSLALGVSLLQPKQYTATASILIDAPLGGDPRAATAVSPIYLESLKTYEHFVESDTLFLAALEKFHLHSDYPGAAPDGLKRRVLKVTKPRDTRILEVSATLKNPVKAQALAQYIAEQTVSLSRSLSGLSEQDLLAEAQRQLDTARANLQRTETALKDESARSPYEALQSEVDNLVELRSRVQKELIDARVDVADYTSQSNRREADSTRARVSTLEKQVADIEVELSAKEKSAAQRRARLDELEADVKAARTSNQLAETRVNDVRQSMGSRSERLRVIDAGIVPERPSSPNTPLNVIGAVFVAAIFTWIYLTIAFALRSQTVHNPVREYSSRR